MKHLAEKIVIYQINQGIITNDEKENYIYAYFILMEQTINIFKGFLKRLNCLLVPNLFRDIYYYIKHIRTGVLKAYILIKTFA